MHIQTNEQRASCHPCQSLLPPLLLYTVEKETCAILITLFFILTHHDIRQRIHTMSRFIDSEFNTKTLSPICGYWSEKLVTLEQAL